MIKHNIEAIVLFLGSILVALLMSELSVADDNGKIIYISKCISCHNKDPAKSGAIGPDIADSSLELITAKTQRREYPKGYTPKRKTKIMPKIPLKNEQLKYLYEYLKGFIK